MSYEQPLSQYSVKAITSAVNNFSGASASYGGPLLKIPEVDVNCCVTLFDNYKLASCNTIFQDSTFQEKLCTDWSSRTYDPDPLNRDNVYQIDGSTAENNMCNCSLVSPATSGYGYYGFDCSAGVFPKNFNTPSIGVYPGCTVKVTAFGKVRGTEPESFDYSGYVEVYEQYTPDCCATVECESPSTLTLTLPSPWVAGATGSNCETPFGGGKQYRRLYAGFSATKTPGAATYCCPGHTYIPELGMCAVLPEDDCPLGAVIFSDGVNPGYCGYVPFYTCDQTLLDLTPTGLSATYTNNSNCLGILNFIMLDFLGTNATSAFLGQANLCFEDSTLYYTVEVLSGGC